MSVLTNIPFVIELLTFLTVACGIGYLLLQRDHGDTNRNRLTELLRPDRPRDMERRLLEARGGRIVQLLSHPLPNWTTGLLPNDVEARSRLRSKLIHAGIYHPGAVPTFCVIKLVLMIGCPLMAVLAASCGLWELKRGLMWGATLGGLGMIAPTMWLERRTRARQRVLTRSLPDFLDLTAACLESGMGMQPAIKRVAEELQAPHPELADEMAMVQREVELGGTIDGALARLAERTNVDDLQSLSSFVEQTQRFGTAMADAVRELADMLRLQRESRAEELAQQASVKILVPTLLFIFPTVFVVLAGPAAIQLQKSFSKNSPNSLAASCK